MKLKPFETVNIERIIYNLRLILFGHILNPFWHSRLKRRQRRGQVIATGTERYLERMLHAPMARSMEVPKVSGQGSEFFFSIWFQGEENAPQLVKSCLKSIRDNLNPEMELVVLDAKTLWDWIELPDYIMDKWKSGKIRPANFSDLCRAELLWRYGGYWIDATCFMTHHIPPHVQNLDIFFYMAGDTLGGSYAFMQSCFIKAVAGHPVIGAWRDAMFLYWQKENKALDYMINLMLMRYAITHDKAAKAEFDEMPKVNQDSTHTIWFGKYRDLPFDSVEFGILTAPSLFQKTTYRTYVRRKPRPGSYAEYIVNYASCEVYPQRVLESLPPKDV